MNLVQMYVLFLVYLVISGSPNISMEFGCTCGGSLLSDTNLNRGNLWENLEKG